MIANIDRNSYRHLFVGVDVQVPLLNSQYRTYVNLDNAASTPSLFAVEQAISDFLPYYSSVHRGTGFKSQLSTNVYEETRRIVMNFLGADQNENICIYGKNTTEVINKLSRRFPFEDQRNVVLTSVMEHHSNDLPWRGVTHTVHIGLTPEGLLNEADFERQIKEYGDRLALVTITGASNVTGFLNPIHEIAEQAHRVGAKILVDCAQLAPHRQIDMRPMDDPSHLDFVALSAHKLYAPFGTGVLVRRRDLFERGDPDQRGGGTVEIVTLDDVVWADPPDRDEAGSPNTIGAVALATAIQKLSQIGMTNVSRHEAELTEYTLRHFQQIPGLHVFGDGDPENASQRLGVIPFELQGISHFKLAAILGYEYGIGVRNGCFCAHPYILHLLKLSQEQAQDVRAQILNGDRSDMPGLVRVSFGLYNSFEDVDALIEALHRITNGEYQGDYIQDLATGEFTPLGWAPQFENYFNINGTTPLI